ncbi:MAG: hypothetical protein GTO62_15895, partial [Planctomycetales bacterium]|nr:hypothetical protein [Planctomycetales bacterium]NIP70706.1 hypothetical protein [Planctomycetales bacterium]
MASFFRLSYQLFGAGHAKAGKSSFRKASGFELLEKRHLLTGDLLASLTGTVVVDVTNNGLTDDDTVVAGAVVRLFRDGGDGVFDG